MTVERQSRIRSWRQGEAALPALAFLPLDFLTRAVFDRVRQNPLVVIDHVPYLLTDIDGWGEHNTVCRCTLRQITNINNLKS